jgi:hypothetical protein
LAKKLTLPRLEKKLDRIFSEWRRRKDADENGYVTCVTCGKVAHYKEMHCGHFRPRRYKATRWSVPNTGVQCVVCNTFNEGEQYLFAKHIDETYGEGTSDELTRESREIVKFSRSELEEKIEYYKEICLNELS